MYYEGPVESKERAATLLASILEEDVSTSVWIDASFLLATLKEQTDRDEAARLYEQAIELGDELDLKGQDSDVQRHLRLTLAKAFFTSPSGNVPI